MRILLSLCALFILSGCVTTTQKRFPISDQKANIERANADRKFRVSVESDGVPVQDYATKLVHRVPVSSRELEKLSSGERGDIQLPFDCKPMKDNQGRVSGVRLIRAPQRGELPAIGLKDRDVVTAVGQKHILNSRDLWVLVEELNQGQQATLTLQRAGKPHKILYYSTSSG